ncbi:hypothetical protein J2T50_001886 [Streptococcus gallinaceus]|uniref:DUF2974 domain-containing protein n=1 Tax=Streptococcus gallinaceus TaxID=165758 RepID=UPI00209F2525|nr:DUF2974 domain-containing protein [Streptococcus gallinaceus]MCP1640163.1 hypothetical protein [Streptococcus gallinaceus]MCP1770945.1 hypothetical protein [Streptococcus gallinaceus]
MANILTYLTNYQYDNFYETAINELDILALTELSYLPFDDLITADFSVTKGIRLDELADKFHEKFQSGYPPLSMVNRDRLALLAQLSQSKRFKYIRAFAYVNDYSLEDQKQFAAVSYRLTPNDVLTVFRGTDDTIIGWKEDFHMTYMAEIPAQAAARDYLETAIETLPANFYVAGHSKGGNLATFASSQVQPALQESIQEVYSFDGPGLHETVLASTGYAAITKRIHSIIPEGSIVGMMLQTPKNAHIVKSTGLGLMQHISFTWEIDDKTFQTAAALTPDSLQMDQTLKTWTASLSPDELKTFFDLFFGLFTQAGIYRFSDMTIDTPAKLQALAQNRQNLSPEERQMLERMTRLLIDTRYQIWKEQNQNRPKFDLEKLRVNLPDFQTFPFIKFSDDNKPQK